MRPTGIRTWRLRQQVLALCVAVGVVLAALAALAVATAARNSSHLDDVLNRIGPMRVAGVQLTTDLVDQETGIRGYAITGQDVNLDPYRQGQQDQQAQLGSIRQSLRGGRRDNAIRADLDLVDLRITQWRTATAEPVLQAVHAHGPGAGQALLDAAATGRFDAIRAAITTMQTDIQILRDQAADAAKQAGRTMVEIQIAALAIVVVAGAVLLLLLDRLVTRPVVELAEQVRLVAEGDYERHLDSGGASELRGLAENVDGMRRRIAAELTEVREARTQIEQVNDQLEIQADELARSNRDLEQFAYVASHDLQEPLRKVASFCQLLQRRYGGQLDERADQYIAFAVDGAQRMQALINDLLAFSRIGRLTTGFTEVDLNRVLGEVRYQLEARAGDDARITWAELPTVQGEEPLLTTLFANLIGNSLKFRRPDIPPVIEVSAERTGEEWHLNVRDNGIGIEPEYADKVFVIFQRLHPRETYEGTGIGLAIVKKIVEYHGGRVWLDHDATPGASINFTFPRQLGEADQSVPSTEQRV